MKLSCPTNGTRYCFLLDETELKKVVEHKKRMKEGLIRKRYEVLLRMVLKINGTGTRTKKETGDKPTAMFEFYGHCGVAQIRVFKKGWYPNAKPDFNSDVRCENDAEYGNVYKALSKIIIEEIGGHND